MQQQILAACNMDIALETSFVSSDYWHVWVLWLAGKSQLIQPRPKRWHGKQKYVNVNNLLHNITSQGYILQMNGAGIHCWISMESNNVAWQKIGLVRDGTNSGWKLLFLPPARLILRLFFFSPMVDSFGGCFTVTYFIVAMTTGDGYWFLAESFPWRVDIRGEETSHKSHGSGRCRRWI